VLVLPMGCCCCCRPCYCLCYLDAANELLLLALLFPFFIIWVLLPLRSMLLSISVGGVSHTDMFAQDCTYFFSGAGQALPATICCVQACCQQRYMWQAVLRDFAYHFVYWPCSICTLMGGVNSSCSSHAASQETKHLYSDGYLPLQHGNCSYGLLVYSGLRWWFHVVTPAAAPGLR
jgi:hypothetical protein